MPNQPRPVTDLARWRAQRATPRDEFDVVPEPTPADLHRDEYTEMLKADEATSARGDRA
jgi:hypothetical protein